MAISTCNIVFRASQSLSERKLITPSVGVILLQIFVGEWTTADITFQLSHDGNSWYELIDEYGNAVSVIPAVNSVVALPIDQMLDIKYLRLRSGTVSVPVQQTERRTLKLVYETR
jgi:hypothetical protein